MTGTPWRDAGFKADIEGQSWSTALLPRFAWLADRLPWFAAPVALHAWPLTGRVAIASIAVLAVALMGHAWMGGRAWHRTPANDRAALSLDHAGAPAGLVSSSSALFQDEAFAEAGIGASDRVLTLTDGLSPSGLRLLQGDTHATTPGARAATAGDGAATVPPEWASLTAPELYAAIAAGERAALAMPGLQARGRSLGINANVVRPAASEPVGEANNAAAYDAGSVADTTSMVRVDAGWSQWISEIGQRRDVAIDLFAIDDRSASQRDVPTLPDAMSRDPSRIASATDFAVARGDATAYDNPSARVDADALPGSSAFGGSEVLGAWPHRTARMVARGGFEPLAAFVAALGATQPPVIVRAARIMPDHDSNGTRLQLQAMLVFLDPDKPRVMRAGVPDRSIARAGTGLAKPALPSAGALGGGKAADVAMRAASDAAVPANPFRRRGQAQTDIVVLATFVSGGRRAALLARRVTSGAVQRGGGSSGGMEVALVRPGETFADADLIAVEGSTVRLRPLLGGAEHVVHLRRDDTGHAR